MNKKTASFWKAKKYNFIVLVKIYIPLFLLVYIINSIDYFSKYEYLSIPVLLSYPFILVIFRIPFYGYENKQYTLETFNHSRWWDVLSILFLLCMYSGVYYILK